jgi:hypothetical protein
MNRITYEVVNTVHLETTFKDRSLAWYMKYKAIASMRQTRFMIEIKMDLLKEFQSPKSKSQCIT